MRSVIIELLASRFASVGFILFILKESKATFDQIKHFYYGNDTNDLSDDERIGKFIEMRSDFRYLYPIQKTIELMASKPCRNTYAYE